MAPYLAASTVEAVLAQRLVRVSCPECARPEPAEAGTLADFGVDGPPLDRVLRGHGCDHCRGTGYRGRTGIYELLVMNEGLRARLLQHRDAGELRRAAVAAGMRTLRADGLRLVREGVTTPEEVLRVARG